MSRVFQRMPLPSKLDFINVSDVNEDILRRFHCSEASLESFLKGLAKSNHNAGAANTTVAIADGQHVLGYYTLKCTCIKISDPEMSDEPKYIPAIEIARFAIDDRYRERGLGKDLFGYVLEKIREIRDNHVGAQMMVLFSLPDVVGFYAKFDFKELEESMATYICSDNDGCKCMYSKIA